MSSPSEEELTFTNTNPPPSSKTLGNLPYFYDPLPKQHRQRQSIYLQTKDIPLPPKMTKVRRGYLIGETDEHLDFLGINHDTEDNIKEPPFLVNYGCSRRLY